MNTLFPVRLSIALVALLASAQAFAGPIELSDDLNARLARVKSQQAAVGAAARSASNPSGANIVAGQPGAQGRGCSISIGNVIEAPGRISTNARRETTVIVTGDVIQVGNNCR